MIRAAFGRPVARHGKLDLARVFFYPLDADLDRIAETVAAAVPRLQARAGRVELLPALEFARGQEALEHVAEADEDAAADETDDLALEPLVPAALEQHPVEPPREAELVGEVLHVRR